MAPDFLAHLAAESARFGDALRDADPDARVPTCPDWSADDLLWHMGGGVFHFWTAIVAGRVVDGDGVEAADASTPDRPADHAGLVAAYDRGRAALIDALSSAGDDERVWTWAGPDHHSAGWIKRRMAQEALIHRVDAEATVGAASPIDPALATDGVLEGLQFFWGGHPSWTTWHPDGPLGRLVTTDTGAQWTVRLGWLEGTHPGSGTHYPHEPALELTDDAGDPSFTVSATAADLDTWMWNRPTVAGIDVDGSREDFAALEAVIASGAD